MKPFIIKFVIALIFVLAFLSKTTEAASPVIKGLVKTQTGAAIPGVWVRWQDNSNQSKWGRATDEGQPGVVAPSLSDYETSRNPYPNYPGRICGGMWYDDGYGNVSWLWTPCCSGLNGSVRCPAYSNVRHVQASATATTYYPGDTPSNFVFPSWTGDGSGNDVCLYDDGVGCQSWLYGLSEGDRASQINRRIDTNLDSANDTFQATTYPDSQRTQANLDAMRMGISADGQFGFAFGCFSNPQTISVVVDAGRSGGSYQPGQITYAALSNSQAVQDVEFTFVPAIPPPPVANNPTIDSLQINNVAPAAGYASDTKASGRQNTPAEGGKGWYNPMTITLNANQGSNPIKSYYVAFYDISVGSAYSSIIDPTTGNPSASLQNLLQGSNNVKKGFVLRYDPGSPGAYYVWDQNASDWRNITDFSDFGWPICADGVCTPETLYYKVYPVKPASAWKILFDKNFESKSMYTAAFVMDNSAGRLSDYEADCTPTSATCQLR